MTDPGEKPDGDERVKSVLEAAERAASEILSDATDEAQKRVAEARERAEQVGRDRVEMMSALSDAMLEQATTVKRQCDLLIDAIDRVVVELELELERPLRNPSPKVPAPVAKAPATPASPTPAPPVPAPPPKQPVQPAAAPPQMSEARRRALQAIRERIARGVDQEQRPPQGRASIPAPPPVAPRQQQPAPRAPHPAPVPTAPAQPAPTARPATGPPANRPVQSQPARTPRRRVSEQAAEGARLLATQMAVAGSTRAEILVRLRKEFGIEDPEPIVDAAVGGSDES